MKSGMKTKKQVKLQEVVLTYQEWQEALKMPTPTKNKKRYSRKVKHISRNNEYKK